MRTTTPEITSTVRIRSAQPEDFDRIGQLTVSAYLDGGHMDTSDSYVQHLTRVADRAARAHLLVAEVEGAVAGSATVTDHHGIYAEVARPGEMEFRMLAVAPEFQGRGIARAMVRHIIAEASSRPEIHAVTLCSLVSMTAAHALYESEGFRRDPRRDFVLHIPQKQATFPFFRREV